MRALIAASTFGLSIAFTGVALAAGGGGGDMGGGGFEASGPSPAEIEQAYNQGVAYIAAGEFKKAATKFAFVTDAAPKSADAWNYLGYSSRKAGNAKRGESAYKRALKLEPNNPRANEYYGELLVELNRVPEAEERLAVLNACCAGTQPAKDLAAIIADAKAGKPVAYSSKQY
jgi:Tfp pilus assembly protein PilF